MKTTLEAENNKGRIQIEIDDDGFDVGGWLTIRVGDIAAEIHINDLLPAIIGFDAKFNRERVVYEQ